MPIGTLYKWLPERGFGFIRADDATRGGSEIFVHLAQFRSARIQPQPGIALAYEIGERDGRPCAINVERIAPRAALEEDE